MNVQSPFPHSSFPFDLRWSAQELTDAVPLRLFELFGFDAESEHAAINQPRFARRAARDWHGGYLRPAPLPVLFRIHN